MLKKQKPTPKKKLKKIPPPGGGGKGGGGENKSSQNTKIFLQKKKTTKNNTIPVLRSFVSSQPSRAEHRGADCIASCRVCRPRFAALQSTLKRAAAASSIIGSQEEIAGLHHFLAKHAPSSHGEKVITLATPVPDVFPVRSIIISAKSSQFIASLATSSAVTASFNFRRQRRGRVRSSGPWRGAPMCGRDASVRTSSITAHALKALGIDSVCPTSQRGRRSRPEFPVEKRRRPSIPNDM